MLAATLISVAFGSDQPPSPGVIVEWLRDDGSDEPATPTPEIDLQPTSTPVPVEGGGFSYPISGACLPDSNLLMPGAPREYRQGVHEGIDFYDVESCAFVGRDTEVLAARAGTVIRADHEYAELTAEMAAEITAEIEQIGSARDATLDLLRGRQVWIDHGDGRVTRYAHLGGVAGDIEVGSQIEQGQLVGYVGESGSIDAIDSPGSQIHLHFEIRVGEGYLGEGMEAAAVRQLYQQAFSPSR
jgi:murein DD-endopeptidase MepM/ murein hydrolase activator NlpD